MRSKHGSYVTMRMPSEAEAAEYGVIILRRGSPRQKWRDVSGRVWQGEPAHYSHLQLECWLAVAPDFDYCRNGFWKKTLWFNDHTTSFDVPGLRSRDEAEKAEAFTTEAVDKLSKLHWDAVMYALSRHLEFVEFKHGVTK